MDRETSFIIASYMYVIYEDRADGFLYMYSTSDTG